MDGRTFRKPRPKKKDKACGKTRFRDRKEANVALARIKTFGEKRERNPQRVYACKNCKGFHVTAVEYRSYKGRLDKSRVDKYADNDSKSPDRNENT